MSGRVEPVRCVVCGGEGSVYAYDGRWWVACVGCNRKGGGAGSRDLAVEAWNEEMRGETDE